MGNTQTQPNHLRANKNTDNIFVLPCRKSDIANTNSKINLNWHIHPSIRHRRDHGLPDATPRGIQKRYRYIIFRFHTDSKRFTPFRDNSRRKLVRKRSVQQVLRTNRIRSSCRTHFLCVFRLIPRSKFPTPCQRIEARRTRNLPLLPNNAIHDIVAETETQRSLSSAFPLPPSSRSAQTQSPATP